LDFADELHDEVTAALNQCTERQRMMFQLTHGINTRGTTERMSVDAAAATLGMKRNTGRSHLREAEARVYGTMLWTRIRAEAVTRTTPREEVMFSMDSTDMRTRSRSHQNDDHRINLGEGSQHMMRVTNGGTGRHPASRQHEQIMRAHEQWTARGEYTPEQMIARYCK